MRAIVRPLPHMRSRQVEQHNRDRDLIETLFKVWRCGTWKDEGKQTRMPGSPFSADDYAPWEPILKNIPILKGVTIRYSFMAVLALSLTCQPIRAMCLSELLRWWKQLHEAVRNPANTRHLLDHSFPIIVRLAGSGGRHNHTLTGVELSDRSGQLLCETCLLEINRQGGEVNDKSSICLQCRIAQHVEEAFSGPTLICWCNSEDPDKCHKIWLRNGWKCGKIHEAQQCGILPS